MSKIKSYVKDHKKQIITTGLLVGCGLVISRSSFMRGYCDSAYDIGKMMELAATENPDMPLRKFVDLEIANGNLVYDYYDLVKRGITKIEKA